MKWQRSRQSRQAIASRQFSRDCFSTFNSKWLILKYLKHSKRKHYCIEQKCAFLDYRTLQVMWVDKAYHILSNLGPKENGTKARYILHDYIFSGCIFLERIPPHGTFCRGHSVRSQRVRVRLMVISCTEFDLSRRHLSDNTLNSWPTMASRTPEGHLQIVASMPSHLPAILCHLK